MSFKALFVLLVVAVDFFNVNASISPTTMFIKQRAEAALQEQIFKARSDISECHNHYSEVLKNLLDTYDGAVKQCKDDESEKLSELANEGQESRDATTASLNAVCASLDECKSETENLNFFDCVNTSGDESTRAVWKASKDASDTAAKIREQIHVIQYQTEKCTSEAERVYIVGTTKATDEMVACYVNGGLPTTAAPSGRSSSELENQKQVEQLKETAVRGKLEGLIKKWENQSKN